MANVVCVCSGRQVQQTAANRFIDVTLELGGNVSGVTWWMDD